MARQPARRAPGAPGAPTGTSSMYERPALTCVDLAPGRRRGRARGRPPRRRSRRAGVRRSRAPRRRRGGRRGSRGHRSGGGRGAQRPATVPKAATTSSGRTALPGVDARRPPPAGAGRRGDALARTGRRGHRDGGGRLLAHPVAAGGRRPPAGDRSLAARGQRPDRRRRRPVERRAHARGACAPPGRRRGWRSTRRTPTAASGACGSPGSCCSGSWCCWSSTASPAAGGVMAGLLAGLFGTAGAVDWLESRRWRAAERDRDARLYLLIGPNALVARFGRTQVYEAPRRDADRGARPRRALSAAAQPPRVKRLDGRGDALRRLPVAVERAGARPASRRSASAARSAARDPCPPAGCSRPPRSPPTPSCRAGSGRGRRGSRPPSARRPSRSARPRADISSAVKSR